MNQLFEIVGRRKRRKGIKIGIASLFHRVSQSYTKIRKDWNADKTDWLCQTLIGTDFKS
jgi:hypothetical protein